MVTFGYELEEEFNAVTQFINDKYGIIIKSKEQLVNFTQKALTFMMTIKVWKKHLMPFSSGAKDGNVFSRNVIKCSSYYLIGKY